MVNMKDFEKLLKLGVFSFADVINLVGNRETAHSKIYRLVQKGYIKSVKRNLYAAVSLETSQTIVNKYQIGSKLTKSAYVSHHSAFEYYGLANQVFNEVYISSSERFNNFEFEGISYKFIRSKFNDGVLEPKNYSGVRVTDIERTVLDGIKDFEKIGGLEELLQCLDMATYLDSKKLEQYLDLYNLQVLYQKTGYILEYYKDKLKLKDSFFKFCVTKIGKSVRYLFKGINSDNSFYNSKWQIVAPKNLMIINDQGGSELV